MAARFLPEAREVFEAAATHYETDRAGRGVRFLLAVDQALLLLEQSSGAGPAWEEADTVEGVRRLAVQRFPYGLIYVEEELLVVAVAHDRQEPGYWIQRLTALREG